jgi:hypothetical protein
MEMFSRKEGVFKDYEKKNIREMYINDFRFNNDRLQRVSLFPIITGGKIFSPVWRIAFFPISAGGKRFSPAKSGCLSGGNVEL